MNISKRVLIIILALTVLTTASVTAATVHKQLTATERQDFTIEVDGLPQTITDARGNRVYPVVINGTTYLPLRSTAQLVGLPVTWDADSLTVKLGEQESSGPKYLFDQQLKGTKYQMKVNDPTLLVVNTDEGQQTFKNGISHSIWNGTMSASDYTRMENFDVSGATKITLTAYSPERDAEVIISGENAKDIVASFEVSKGTIVTKTYQLDGRHEISFGINGTNSGGTAADAYIFDAFVE
ncbi:hypothetical protein DUZ99_07600 [Xylanibacillus composti]|uniref:Copper amine oxidase-like N-terminal domain-containing protein n=1 Tax=Xylanibacillus composti TaxID=1572762 RepID=A0A8J4H5W4_9BACL|nr:stalk domain-containing protein [Xylanibacillus composti]MDT9724857.1 hypothetical protein [Xylanibacillus composti]GIQ69048.1 hypothetical protein XYCOK13_18720 [Xylanibacillus composti]